MSSAINFSPILQAVKQYTLVILVRIQTSFESTLPVMEPLVLRMSIRQSTCWKPSEQVCCGNFDAGLIRNIRGAFAGTTRRIGDRDWKYIWLESPEYEKVLTDIAAIKQNRLSRPHDAKNRKSTCECYRAFGPSASNHAAS